ncbi:TRAP-type transport system periplasmic substrate-binding protein [Halobacterium hubeiense]|jgi:TRAP transporter TAXI family solute receptor|uniref:TRAP-type transport system periplasmic substrate-binding protein n=1 Tax=Halobacterium hubeiense TaxID=1407499 RepID=A0A0U5GYY9_9EURY|nr:TAXI family TRAP transporter solute-binding subunit [Halobacterium hubeiense]CQH51838.1 TRAP-type transport system periplasmic substrate-binding protein [Halobacterium hubeiense]
MSNQQSRRRFLQAAGLTGVAALAGCLGGGSDGNRLSWHAGGQGGTYFPLSNEFKTVVEDNTDYTLNVQSTGASVENVGSLADTDADFALIQNDIAYFAKNGTGIDAFQDDPVENLMGVATLYPETITLVTLESTGIETVSDLSGATVNTGDLGSGTQVNALQILEAVGVDDFEEQNASFSQAADQLRNGDIDAAFVVGGWPVGAIADLANTNNLNIVPIDGENREAVKDSASWFANDTIPGGTYSGVSEDVETVSVQAMIATNDSVDDSTVEEVTAAIFDNVDDLTIKTDFIGADSAQDGMSIELHPGAAAYFDQ